MRLEPQAVQQASSNNIFIYRGFYLSLTALEPSPVFKSRTVLGMAVLSSRKQSNSLYFK